MKRTLYPKLLAGYLMYGVIGFLIITTFTYHITFAFVEKKEAASLYRESALISSNYAGNYFSKTMTLDEIQTQLSTLSTLQRNLDRGHARQHHSEHGGAGL